MKKFITNLSFRKKIIIMGSISLVAVFTLAFLVKNLGTNLSASVSRLDTADRQYICNDTDRGRNYTIKGTVTLLTNGYITNMEEDYCNSNEILKEWFCGRKQIDPTRILRSENYTCINQDFCHIGKCTNCNDPEIILACSLGLETCPIQCSGQTVDCSDPNILYACANCNDPQIVISCSLGLDTCPLFCQSPSVTNTGLVCPTQCATAVCNDPAIVYACNHGYLWACPIACQNGGTGYGYGYGRGGNGTGYGYGYGYTKLNIKTQQPYLYLIDVFKKYSEKIYINVIKKIGFQIVKFYNTKEFTPTTKK